MRLYPSFLPSSTPFVVFFLKKVKIFLVLKKYHLKTMGYKLKKFSKKIKNIGVLECLLRI